MSFVKGEHKIKIVLHNGDRNISNRSIATATLQLDGWVSRMRHQARPRSLQEGETLCADYVRRTGCPLYPIEDTEWGGGRFRPSFPFFTRCFRRHLFSKLLSYSSEIPQSTRRQGGDVHETKRSGLPTNDRGLSACTSMIMQWYALDTTYRASLKPNS